MVIVGLILWLATTYNLLGIILLIVGLVLLFAPTPGVYGYTYYRGRRGPP